MLDVVEYVKKIKWIGIIKYICWYLYYFCLLACVGRFYQNEGHEKLSAKILK